MTAKIFRSMISMIVATLMICCIFFIALLYVHFTEQTMQGLRDEAYLMAKVMEEDEAYLTKLSESRNRITLIESDGTVLFDTDKDASLMENHSDRQEIRQALQNGEGEASRVSATIGKRTLYFAVILKNGNVLRIAAETSAVWMLVLAVVQPMAVIFVIVSLVAYYLSKHVSRKIVAPLNALDLSGTDITSPYEELVPVIHKINSQNESIRKQVQELKRLNVEQSKNEQIRREFTANVSHELKTPLTTIYGISDMLCSGLVRADDIIDFCKTVRSESQRMIHLIEDILHLSQLDEGGADIEKEKVCLKELALEIADRLNYIAEQERIIIIVEGDETQVNGVRSVLTEMIYNITENAVKYNRQGGEVVIRTGIEAGRSYIQVKDTGIGIPESEQERIFERFYRVDKSHSRKIGGTGLGLSIVKHGAILHNAVISLESKIDKGTTVKLSF